MSLNGRLESIPLVEVLRLLARSKQTGALRIEVAGNEAKIYLEEGRLTFATTKSDALMRVELLNAGLVSNESWDVVERRKGTAHDALVEPYTTRDLLDFIRESGTDVIFKVARVGRGQFDFGEDVSPRYDIGESVDVEECIDEAEARIGAWEKIEEVVPSVDHRLALVPELPEGAKDVTITSDTWRLLAAVGDRGSVAAISERIGASEFIVAQAMAQLVRQGLVEVQEALRTEQNLQYSEPEQDGETLEDEAAVSSDAGGVELVDETELFESVLSDVLSTEGPGDAGKDGDSAETEELDEDALKVLTGDYDPEDDIDGSLAERAQALMKRRSMGSLTKELSDLVGDE